MSGEEMFLGYITQRGHEWLRAGSYEDSDIVFTGMDIIKKEETPNE